MKFHENNKICIFLLISLIVVACGGGKGGGDDDNVGSSGVEIEGVAATGAPIKNNEIIIKLNEGDKFSIPTDENGKFSTHLSDETDPVFLQIKADDNTTLYSIGISLRSAKEGKDIVNTMNITNLTDVVVRSWFAKEGRDIDAEFSADEPISNPPTAEEIEEIKTNVNSLIDNTYSKFGIKQEFDLIKTPFDANNKEFDKLLDHLNISFESNKISIVFTDPDTNQFTSIVDSLSLASLGYASFTDQISHSLNITISGLSEGNSITLSFFDNINDDFTSTENGDFTYTMGLIEGVAHTLTVSAQPSNPSQLCLVNNINHALIFSNVSNVYISCEYAFNIETTISGLVGEGLILQNNYDDKLAIELNGAYQFDKKLKNGSDYNVIVFQQPQKPLQVCNVINGIGVIDNEDITNTMVKCEVPISKPIATQVEIIDANGGAVEVGDKLTGTFVYSNTGDSGEGTSTFQWLLDDVAITGETSTFYIPVASDLGKTIVFEVTPIDSMGSVTGITVSSSEIVIGSDIMSQKITPKLAVGFDHVCLLDQSGVECWGGVDVPQLDNPRLITAGADFTCAVDDSAIKCWGGGSDLDPGYYSVFISDIKTLDSGLNHACKHNDSGSFWCWGKNYNGELNVPDHLVTKKFSVFAVGVITTCGIHSKNQVECWGRNESLAYSPPMFENPTQMVLGKSHACVLDSDTVKCWGKNAYNQLGVPILDNPTYLSSGNNHTCVLDKANVLCWGDNSFGQTNVPDLSNPTLVELYGDHSCAKDDAGVVCWGKNNRPRYSDVPQLENPIMIGTGDLHTCALDDSGIHCWGDSRDGKLDVPEMSNPTQLSVGADHSCAIADGGTYCWGNNSSGQSNNKGPLLQVSAGNKFTCGINLDSHFVCWGKDDDNQAPSLSYNDSYFQISSGGRHACALRENNLHRCWGSNSQEAIRGFNSIPEDEKHKTENIIKFSAGYSRTCLLSETGVVCWGMNTEGEYAVPALANPTQISAGTNHTCAIDDTGVVCWGLNFYGQMDVPQLTNPTQISASQRHTCAIDDTGVVCWPKFEDLVRWIY